MTIEHHPPETMIAGYAGGTLEHGLHIAVATHLVTCAHCRRFVRSVEHVGGNLLASLPPSPMARTALANVESRLDERTSVAVTGSTAAASIEDPATRGLPTFLRHYRWGNWKWVAPRVSMRPVELPVAGPTRVFLLKAGAGTTMLPHTHSGIEITCVLHGAFRQAGARLGPGDFDLGDGTIDHRPQIESDEECLCLVAMQGDLRMKGIIGRIVQPFVRL